MSEGPSGHTCLTGARFSQHLPLGLQFLGEVKAQYKRARGLNGARGTSEQRG